ncbi:LppU/SCO3897 family protein [Streptomyces sp. 4N509B]|uniref:LppU/SCO3897 family protein n=1 Tax=Streptomyces sp. 4N509B TaxID=3457413 RepID=UPI003FD628CA
MATIVAVVVALSFGLALATGANERDDAGADMAGAGPAGAAEGAAEGGVTEGGDLELPGPSADGGASEGAADSAGAGTTGTTGGTGGTDAGATSGGDSGGTTGYETPTPPPDPTLEAYRAVNAGDCLNNWMTGESSWVSDTPDVISCDDDAAGVWVSQTSDSTSDCPMDAGRSYLSYTSGAETVALCVTRQFEVGQCFLGMSDGSANLMSWHDCAATSVPSPYSQLYNVTGVYSAPSSVQGDECRQTTYDQNEYWWWTIDGGSILLCAVVHSS